MRVKTGDEEQTLRARAVVGADGRYSLVARKTGARVTEERTDISTLVYFARWEGVAPYAEDGELVAQIHSAGGGWSVVMMPHGGGRESVVMQAPADRFPAGRDITAFYDELVHAHPLVARRVRAARRITALRGMKRVGNLFREPGGPGWALVGDAYHQKDPIDAQGIHDALLGAKYLAEALIPWARGERSWAQAVDDYGRRIYGAMKPMFDATAGRLTREMFSEPPAFIARTVLRWIICDPAYRARFAKLLSRTIDPSGWFSPGLIAGSIARGVAGDLRALLSRRPLPNTSFAP